MKYSPGFKTLATVAGINTLLGLGLTATSIGFAAQSAATPLPVLATGASSQVALAIAGTTILAIGIISLAFLYSAKKAKDESTYLEMPMGTLGIIMFSIAMVLGVGYGIGHLSVAASVASLCSGWALVGVEAGCGTIAAAIPLVLTMLICSMDGFENFNARCFAATVGIIIAGAGSALVGPAFASLVGAIGSEAIAVECMTAVILAMIPASIFILTEGSANPTPPSRWREIV